MARYIPYLYSTSQQQNKRLILIYNIFIHLLKSLTCVCNLWKMYILTNLIREKICSCLFLFIMYIGVSLNRVLICVFMYVPIVPCSLNDFTFLLNYTKIVLNVKVKNKSKKCTQTKTKLNWTKRGDCIKWYSLCQY